MVRKLDIFGKSVDIPRSQPLRIALGVALVLGGLVGFLPVLGFWMIPLGLFVLSIDLPWLRRKRREWAVRREKAKRVDGNKS